MEKRAFSKTQKLNEAGFKKGGVKSGEKEFIYT